MIVQKVRLVPCFEDRESVGESPRRRKYANRVGKLKEILENRGEFRGTGFKSHSWYNIRAFKVRGVELEKGFMNLACREFDR